MRPIYYVAFGLLAVKAVVVVNVGVGLHFPNLVPGPRVAVEVVAPARP